MDDAGGWLWSRIRRDVDTKEFIPAAYANYSMALTMSLLR